MRVSSVIVPLAVFVVAAVAAPDEIVIEDWKAYKVGAIGLPGQWTAQNWGTPNYQNIKIVDDDGRRALHMKSVNDSLTINREVKGKVHLKDTPILEWEWKSIVLPKGGNECKEGRGDSAAVVYVSWKRGLKWYSLKYAWSSESEKGRTCDRKRNLFVAQDTVVVESGGPVGEWRTEDIDPSAEFRAHFEDGNPNADVPDLVGVGIMSDGDQTKSISAADYTGFELVH